MEITRRQSRGRAALLITIGVMAAVVAIAWAMAAPAAAGEPELAAAAAGPGSSDATSSPIMLPLVLGSVLIAARAASTAAGDRRG